MKILALDLGKFKSVFCLLTDRQPEYGKVSTDRQSIHDLLVKHQPDRLVMEIGPGAGWVHDLATALDLTVQVANPNDERWHWKRVKEKSDRKDAFKLADLSRMNDLPVMPMPSANVRQWRSLMKYRDSLVGSRTRVKNSIRAIFQMQGELLPKTDKAWSRASLEEIGREADPTPPAHQLWRLQLHSELQCLRSLEQQIEQIVNEEIVPPGTVVGNRDLLRLRIQDLAQESRDEEVSGLPGTIDIEWADDGHFYAELLRIVPAHFLR